MGTEMTRRQAIRTGLGLAGASGLLWTPALAAGKEFWNEKKPESWTEEERHELLTKSPWAKEPTTKYDGGGGANMTRGMSTNRRGGISAGGARTPSNGTPTIPDKFPSVVRWESALPVREATGNVSKDDPAANYILKISGDLPMLSPASDDETESEYARRLEPLKQFTKLEKKGDPIYLTDMRYDGKGANAGALFFFVRNDLITLDDKAVTLVTKLGPISVKVKFTLHDMMYHGKLEL
jgi:hypothetical protein